MDFANVAADLIDNLSLLFNLLLSELERSQIILADFLCLLLFVIDFLHLHCESLDFKLHFLVLPRLLLYLTVLALLHGLMRAHLVIQILNSPKQVRLCRIGVLHFQKLCSEFPLNLLEQRGFLNNGCLCSFKFFCEVFKRLLPLPSLRLPLLLVLVSVFHNLSFKLDVVRPHLLKSLHVHFSLLRHYFDFALQGLHFMHLVC